MAVVDDVFARFGLFVTDLQ